MASKCVNGALKWRLWVASVLSREPPGKELTYFLWLLSFWVRPLCNTVVQCRPDECSKKKKKKKKKKRKVFVLLFTFYPSKHAQDPISYSNKYSAGHRYENAAGPNPDTCEWDLLRRASGPRWAISVEVCLFVSAGFACPCGEQRVRADVWVWAGRSWEVRRDLFLTLPWFPCPFRMRLLEAHSLGTWAACWGTEYTQRTASARCGSFCLWTTRCSSHGEGANRWNCTSRLWYQTDFRWLLLLLLLLTWGNPLTPERLCIFRVL